MSGKTVSNQGIGGETSTQVAARAGAVPTAITLTGDSLPASGTVVATTSTNVPSSQSGTLVGTVAGVPVTLSYSGGSILVQRREAVAASSSVPAASSLSLEAGSVLAYWRQIIWVGRNDIDNAAATAPSVVAANIAAIVAASKAGKYIILSVLNRLSEPSSGSAYGYVAATNALLSATYGTRFLDIRAYLIAHGLSDASISATAQDLADIANDTVPTSLRSDDIHLNASGYTVVGQQVYAKLQSLGWA